MMDVSRFPGFNAILNGISAFLLAAGLVFIKKKRVLAHRIFMGLAFISSSLFLASYLYYHARAGSKHFEGTGGIRSIYFFILGTHTVLAAAVPPLALTTLFWAMRGEFLKHKAWARWTFPIWMYVSLTGILIYWMLYRLPH